MNPVLWSAMQTQDVLHQVDLMLPKLVDDDDLKLLEVIRPFKDEVVESDWFQTAIDNGGALTWVGVAMLAVPDPVIYYTASHFVGPVGAVVVVVVWNAVAVGLILLDQVI